MAPTLFIGAWIGAERRQRTFGNEIIGGDLSSGQTMPSVRYPPILWLSALPFFGQVGSMSIPTNAETSLNDGEKEVLALLAAGHTVKTAAAELGLTDNAVNERLRSARRKTGASSSRELARQLYPTDPQISWDEVSVVPSALQPKDGDERRFPILGRWRTKRGVLIMTSLTLITAALVALTQVSSNETSSAPDEALPPLAASGMELRERLESEQSDPAWALATQSELSKRFSQRDGVDMAAVRCRTSLCEINAFVLAENRRAATRAIGDRIFLESLFDAGVSKVETIDMRFMSSEDRGTITVFVSRGE